ncbi:MAG: hypothetical protein AAFZ89_14245 [Bacteroidota bacterium]
MQAQDVGEGTITYKSPSKKFMDITIHSYNGLPRIGEVYFIRGVTPPTNQKAFNVLLQLKYMEKAYADMDKNKLTTYEEGRSGDKKLQHSFAAQNHLLTLAKELCTKEELEKYFGPEKQAKSSSYGYNKNANAQRLNFWGGDRNNEFAQQRAYTSFVKNNLADLQAWSQRFFEGDTQTAYMINIARVAESYDFQKKGYWIRINLGGGALLIDQLRFTPFDQDQQTVIRKKLLMPMAPEEAKKYAFRKQNAIKILSKVTVSYDKEYSTNNSKPAFSFELENPIIEVYNKGRTLTEKIGEINLEKALAKY